MGRSPCSPSAAGRKANTAYAQGGIAAVLGASDSLRAAHPGHAGRPAAACADEDAVRACVTRGAGAGARADRARAPSSPATPRRSATTSRARAATRGGASCTRRTDRARGRAHAARGGATRAGHHSSSRTTSRSTCSSPAKLRRRAERVLRRLRARRRDRARCTRFVASAVVLATGGAGKVYLYTTNPDVATGDGVAMAYRAGAAVGEPRVHPVPPDLPLPPATRRTSSSREALRGEGGILRQHDGEAFMERYHPLEDARAARRRGARDRQRAQAPRRRLRVPRHDAPRRRRSCVEHFPNIYEQLPGASAST